MQKIAQSGHIVHRYKENMSENSCVKNHCTIHRINVINKLCDQNGRFLKVRGATFYHKVAKMHDYFLDYLEIVQVKVCADNFWVTLREFWLLFISTSGST